MKKKLTLVDYITLGIVILIGLAALILFFGTGKNSGSNVLIELDGKEYASYDLSENQTIEIKNKDNTNVLEIKDGQVFMKEANCKDHLCVNQGKKSKDGQSIICLPHKLVVTVISEKEDDYDSIAK